jgi:hypothetical protein
MDVNGHFKTNHSSIRPLDGLVNTPSPLPAPSIPEFPDVRFPEIVTENHGIRAKVARFIQILHDLVALLSDHPFAEEFLHCRVGIQNVVSDGICHVDLLVDRVEDRNEMLAGLVERLFRSQPLNQLSLGTVDSSFLFTIPLFPRH